MKNIKGNKLKRHPRKLPIISKIKIDRVSYDLKDKIIQQLQNKGISVPGTSLNDLVDDLLLNTMPRRYAQFIRYVADRYNVNDLVAEKIINIVRRGEGFEQGPDDITGEKVKIFIIKDNDKSKYAKFKQGGVFVWTKLPEEATQFKTEKIANWALKNLKKLHYKNLILEKVTGGFNMLELVQALVKKGNKKLAFKVIKAFDEDYDVDEIKDATYKAIGNLSDYLTNNVTNTEVNELGIMLDQVGDTKAKFIISDKDGNEYGSINTSLEIVDSDEPYFTYQFTNPKKYDFKDKDLERALLNFLKTQTFEVDYTGDNSLRDWVTSLTNSGKKFLNTMIKSMSKYTKG